jgi:hypothetical protein
MSEGMLERPLDPHDRDVLRPDETDLVGQWLDTGNRIEGDAVSARIERLIGEHLVRVAERADGSRTLYRDPLDGRFWERTYPYRTPRNDGPPRLTLVPTEHARAEYGVPPD